MKLYDKRMIALVVLAGLLLTIKSVVLDPVKPVEADLVRYSGYAALSAPYLGSEVPPPSWLYTYRTIEVEKTGTTGKTIIMHIDPATQNLTEEVLAGTYQARVRGYILWVLPATQITIEGGLAEHGSIPDN